LFVEECWNGLNPLGRFCQQAEQMSSLRRPNMGIVSWIIFGLIAGALAKALMPGRDPGGCLVTMLLGIVGASVGGFIGTQVLHFGTVNKFDLRSLSIAILGALFILAIYRLLLGRPPRPNRF
jgi:uncharacterized membrane protein YeaQ/YmgE (transglycosylase-associated protein family)